MSDFKMGFLCGSLLFCVVGELCKGNPVCPFILFFCDKDAEVLLEIMVHLFHLGISMRVISGREFGDNSKVFAEIFHYLRGKLGSAIGDNSARKAMIFPYMK